MFVARFTKTAVSMRWTLDRVRGGVMARKKIRPGTRMHHRVESLTRGTSMDGSLRAEPRSNRDILRQLGNGVPKNGRPHIDAEHLSNAPLGMSAVEIARLVDRNSPEKALRRRRPLAELVPDPLTDLGGRTR